MLGLSRLATPVIGELGPWTAVRKSTGTVLNRVKEKSQGYRRQPPRRLAKHSFTNGYGRCRTETRIELRSTAGGSIRREELRSDIVTRRALPTRKSRTRGRGCCSGTSVREV